MSHIQPDTTLPKTPRIRIYTAQLSQNGAAQPPTDIVILQNTLTGPIVWTYSAPLEGWVGTLTNGFTGNVAILTTSGAWILGKKIDANSISVEVFSETFARDVTYWPDGSAIEVRVYE